MDIIGQVKIADVLRKLYMGDLQRVAGYEFKPQKGACVRLPPNKGEALPRRRHGGGRGASLAG